MILSISESALDSFTMFFAVVILVLVTKTNSQNSAPVEPVTTCADIVCGKGLTCEETSSGGKCVKTGACPILPNGTVGICILRCSTDAECQGNLKCCGNGCGRDCFTPVFNGCALVKCRNGYVCNEYPTGPRCDPIEKPGECRLTRCPVYREQRPICTPGTCEVDFDCNGTQKCCKGCNGCGYCFDPPAPPSCKNVTCDPGFFCILRPVQCVRKPCYPQPTCVPLAEKCYTPAAIPDCQTVFPRWYYDKNSGQCNVSFECYEYNDGFSTKNECDQICRGI